MSDTGPAALQITIGQNIKSLRIQNKYSIRALALIADIEHHQLINIEKGRVDMKISTLQKIADALKIEVKDLF